MSLRYVDNSRQQLSMDLHDFLEPHGTLDKHFDRWCNWVEGRTREFLDKTDDPSHTELLELCLHLERSPAFYVQLLDSDGSDKPRRPPWAKCTEDQPCCVRRLQERMDRADPESPDYPCNCLCHN